MRHAFTALKITSLVVGFVGTCFVFAALLGYVGVVNLWIRGGVAAGLATLLPLLVANQFIPKEEGEGLGKGVVGNTFAVVWMAIATLAFGAIGPYARPVFEEEAVRLADEGLGLFGALALVAIGPAAKESTRPPRDAAAAEGADAGAQPGDESSDAGSPPTTALGRPPPPPPSDKDAPKAAGKALSPAELFERCASSVVTVSVKGPRGAGGGTGFVIDHDGTIATNHHVIAGARQVRIKLMDGTWLEDVELLTSSPEVDLALLRVTTSGKALPLPLGDSDVVIVGERVVSIGNPLGLEHTLTDGLVSARRIWQGRRMIQMSAPVSPGNSGGPLFNLRGEVIGVTTAKVRGGLFGGMGENLNLAVPVNVLKGMIAADYPARRRFGASTW